MDVGDLMMWGSLDVERLKELIDMAETLGITERFYDENIVLDVFAYIHSGVTINTHGFNCPWDSGQVGWIYIPRRDVRELFDWKKISHKREQMIRSFLEEEVKEYDEYLQS